MKDRYAIGEDGSVASASVYAPEDPPDSTLDSVSAAASLSEESKVEVGKEEEEEEDEDLKQATSNKETPPRKDRLRKSTKSSEERRTAALQRRSTARIDSRSSIKEALTSRSFTESDSQERKVAPSSSASSATSASDRTEKTRTSRSATHNNKNTATRSSSSTTKSTDGDACKRTTQQLIVLRHAARCPYATETNPMKCPIHKQCAEMKDLLEHMAVCKLAQCSVPHCSTHKGFMDVVAAKSHAKKDDKKTGTKAKHDSSPPSKGKSPFQGKDKTEKNRNETRQAAPKSPLEEEDGPSIPDVERIAPGIPATVSLFQRPCSSNEVKDALGLRNSSSSQSLVQDSKEKEQEEGKEENDLELGGGLQDTTLDEQQSLLEEIARRREMRAPKSFFSLKNKRNVPSSASISTMGSITRQIKNKAESILKGFLSKDDQDTTDASSSLLTQSVSSFYDPNNQNQCRRLIKFFCVALGLMAALSAASLVLLYAFGGEEWDIFISHFGINRGTNSTNVLPLKKTSTVVPTAANEQNSPTAAPTTFIQGLPDYTTAIIQSDFDTISNNPDDVRFAPQTKAFEFIENEKKYFEDLLQAHNMTTQEAALAGSLYSDEEWNNRFALATLYYSTSNGISSNWTDDRGWVTKGVSECNWAFFSCDRNPSLWITENNLAGTLPPEIGMMTAVQDIAILNNPELKGSIPTQLGLLNRTVSINFQGNGLTQSIPSELSTMGSVRWLYLNNNHVQGSVPTELAEMSKLGFLWLQDNQLSGTLNPALFKKGGFEQLQELMLHNNALSGTIPDVFALPKLRLLTLSRNKLSGSVPPSLAGLPELRVLNLHENSGLTGSIPKELCDKKNNGTLTTISIDCELVACDCGCTCNVRRGTSVPTTAPGVGVAAITDRPPRPTNLTTSSVVATMNVTISPVTDAPTPSPTAVPVEQETTLVLPTPSPSIAETSVTDDDANLEQDTGNAETDFISSLLNSTKNALLVDNSPQSLALSWLQSDPNLGSYTLERKLQRFALAAIFYATNGTDAWYGQDYWLDYDTHECNWYNTNPKPDEENVCAANGTNGELVMTQLFQWRNNIVGALPPEIGLLTTLETIYVGMNNITELPTEIGLLTGLRVLNMKHNIMEGPIISSIGEMTQLTRLDLSENFLSGAIPSEFGELSSLDFLILNHNFLSAAIPPEIGELVNINAFNVAANSISATLPSEIGRWTNLQYLDIYGNWFYGTVPTTVGQLTNLLKMDIEFNYFSGTIPSNLGSLTNIEQLQLYNNAFSGSVPSTFAQLTNLVAFSMYGNSQLTGTVPNQVCQLAATEGGKLQSMITECTYVPCGNSCNVCTCVEDIQNHS